jgi:hypothetical protein
MSETIFKQSFEAAKEEVAKLLRERKAIDDRLAVLTPFVEYLSAVVASKSPVEAPMPSVLDLGLTDAIRYEFKAASPIDGLSATETRDRLREHGFHLDKYANELPPIHNTIARLEKAGELQPILRPDGTKASRWVSSLKRAVDAVEKPILTQYINKFMAERFGLPIDENGNLRENAAGYVLNKGPLKFEDIPITDKPQPGYYRPKK